MSPEARAAATRPTLSVVIATYGRAHYVRQAVLAALYQDLEPDEVVVSDDCSPDDTLEVLAGIARYDPRLRVVANPVNSGGVPNWNRVIEASSGDLIAWCSDDDFFLPHHLRVMVRCFEVDPELGMVHGGFLNLDDYGDARLPMVEQGIISKRPLELRGTEVLEHIIRQRSYPFQPSTMVFRRELWRDVGPFDPSYELADTDWFIRAGLRWRIAYLPYCGAVNRRHGANWSLKVGSVGMHREFHDMMCRHLAEATARYPSAPIQALRRRWLMSHTKTLARIYVSRCRAGWFEVADEALTQILRAWGLAEDTHLDRAIRRFARTIARGLRALQSVLPGGKEKYKVTISPR